MATRSSAEAAASSARRDGAILVGELLGEGRDLAGEPLAVAREDLVRRGAGHPRDVDVRGLQHALDVAALGIRDEHDRDAAPPGPAGAAAAVDQHLRVLGQVGVDHEAEIGQVEAAGGDVGGDADAGAAVTQRLQRDQLRSRWPISPDRATTVEKPRSSSEDRGEVT